MGGSSFFMTIKTALGAQRYNNRMDKIWEKAKSLQGDKFGQSMDYSAKETSKILKKHQANTKALNKLKK